MSNYATEHVSLIVCNDYDTEKDIEAKVEDMGNDDHIKTKDDAIEILAEYIEDMIEPLLDLDFIENEFQRLLISELMDSGTIDYEEIAESFLEDWEDKDD